MSPRVTLALDTSESRGSVAARQDGRLSSFELHQNDEDYSSWLLPAVHDVLREARSTISDLSLLAVSTGPGSFTGLRVGLTTVKAWAEAYRTPVVGISRLEALANRGPQTATQIAAYYDAQRGQVFAGLFHRDTNGLQALAPEAVLTSEAFLELVSVTCGAAPVSWVPLDPALILRQEKWRERAALGDKLLPFEGILADSIGELAEERARKHQFSDPVTLDANYVRRSDAELSWKGNLKYVR